MKMENTLSKKLLTFANIKYFISSVGTWGFYGSTSKLMAVSYAFYHVSVRNGQLMQGNFI